MREGGGREGGCVFGWEGVGVNGGVREEGREGPVWKERRLMIVKMKDRNKEVFYCMVELSRMSEWVAQNVLWEPPNECVEVYGPKPTFDILFWKFYGNIRGSKTCLLTRNFFLYTLICILSADRADVVVRYNMKKIESCCR